MTMPDYNRRYPDQELSVRNLMEACGGKDELITAYVKGYVDNPIRWFLRNALSPTDLASKRLELSLEKIQETLDAILACLQKR